MKEGDNVTCIYCGEIYSPQELKETAKDYDLSDKGFICPLCLSTINRKTVEEQVKELLRIGGLPDGTAISQNY